MSRWKGKKVAVLLGGRSSEREVSLKTGAACATALESRGLDVVRVDVGLDVAARLRDCGAEVAFIALHGRYGEDGSIQGLLESLAIPYTGSGVLASAICMDKVVSKLLFRSLGLAVADYRVFPAAQASTLHAKDFPFTFPVVVKPACEGSSVGVSLVKDPTHLAAACAEAARWKGDLIIERYVKGKELQVAVLDGKAMGVIEVVPANEFYDYAAKYTAGTTQYFYPARIPESDTRKLMEAAELAHRGMGCAGVTRSDFILAADGIRLHPRGQHAAGLHRHVAGAQDRGRERHPLPRALRAAPRRGSAEELTAALRRAARRADYFAAQAFCPARAYFSLGSSLSAWAYCFSAAAQLPRAAWTSPMRAKAEAMGAFSSALLALTSALSYCLIWSCLRPRLTSRRATSRMSSPGIVPLGGLSIFSIPAASSSPSMHPDAPLDDVAVVDLAVHLDA